MKYLIVLILFLDLVFSAFGFSVEDDSLKNPGSILFEKVYLHIDRELYAPGDEVWFKSYLVSGVNNQLIPGYKNIYVELISASGVILENKLLLSKGGTAKGDFHLSDSLDNGIYTVRAHTKYQKNFGEESYFYKKIVVSASQSSLDLSNKFDEIKPTKIDVSFLPEGGNFVLNAVNRIAFKAIDETGKGISMKGKIVDETGEEVVAFETTYKGMGKFVIMPQEGKTYYAMVEGFPDFNYQFETPKPDGISLHYEPDGNYLLVSLFRNLKVTATEYFVLKASHKGMELFNSPITMTDFQHAQRLYKGLFPLGISKVSLIDKSGNKIAERLIFVRNKNDSKLQIELDKTEYKTREKVEIDIASLLTESDTITSKLSVAVVHEDYFSAGGNNQTIESYLLLDSELKGSIESPASCFVDDSDISAEEKIDLIMLVNGWRSYYWDDLEKFRGAVLPNWADIGLSIKGNVVKQWGGKPVDNGKVIMGPFSSSFIFEETRTDSHGNFSFDKLYLKDSALIMINAETKNGSKRTNLTLEPQPDFDSKVSAEILINICPDIIIPQKFYRDNYYRLLAEREFRIKSGILLDDVTVIGQKVTGDGHFRLYSEPDISFTIKDEDRAFLNILDYLDGRVPGVLVNGEEVRIRNAQRNPLLLVDGLATEWSDMVNIPVGDIDKIEILKSGFAMATFGSRGGDGVISVLTKMGKGEWENNWERIIHGRITPRVRGFQQAREFYSPKYTYENINDARPDYRPTLFWNPDVAVTNGSAKIEFFTSDNLARYQVVVEGISKNGKICSATSLFSVSIPRK